MENSQIIYAMENGIVTISINRPEKINAVGFPAIRQLMAAFAKADTDPEAKVIIFKGEGEKGFCSGDDTKCPEWLDIGFNWLPGDMYLGLRKKHYYQLLQAIRELTKPVIAQVHGWCLGSAPELALACDIVIASENTKFGIPLVSFGISSMTAFLPKVVGYHRACEILFTGDVVDAKQAFQIGMVNHIYPQEQLNEKVLELATKMSKQSISAIGWTKWALNKTMGSVAEAIDYEVLAVGLTHPSKYVPRTHERPARPFQTI